MSPTTRRGANAVELALVLPVLLFLMAAVLDYGVYFDTRRDVVAAVRDGTRAAVAHPVLDEVEDLAVRKTAEALANQGVSDVTVTATLSGEPRYQLLTVAVRATYHAPIGIIPSPPDYVASFTMMLEHQ